MAREPNDIFIKEFFQHPGWEAVFEHFNGLIRDLELAVINGQPNDFEKNRGRLAGVYDAISHLKMMMKTRG